MIDVAGWIRRIQMAEVVVGTGPAAPAADPQECAGSAVSRKMIQMPQGCEYWGLFVPTIVQSVRSEVADSAILASKVGAWIEKPVGADLRDTPSSGTPEWELQVIRDIRRGNRLESHRRR